MGPIVRVVCSLFLMAALTAGLIRHLNYSRPQHANADQARPPERPLGLIAGLIGAGALISFLILLSL